MLWQSARTQSPLRRITNTSEEGISINPSISGDGRVVGFESTEDIAGAGGVESFRAIRANVAVDPPTFLQMGATRSPAPAISQDGSRIAFASKDNPLGTNNDANSEIFLYDGAKLVQVTNTSPGDPSLRVVKGNFLPSISDDGRFIAFSSNRDLANQNSDGNLEIFIFDTVALSISQLTNSSSGVGATDAKISGNGASVAYIRDSGTTASAKRDLLLQNRVGPPAVRVLATAAQSLAMTYGRAISDDGQRVVWSAETATNTTQVFLFDGRNNNTTRQITGLGSRATDVPLHPTISGNGSRIAFATRRSVFGAGSNSDTSVELYTFDIPSGTVGRVTNVNSSSATAEVLSSMNDDGGVIAFNYPRILSGAVSNDDFANNSEIYLTGTPVIPAFGTLTILNRASMGHEPSSIKAVAPDSIAVALGSALSFRTEQSQRQADGTFPLSVGGTTVTVNGRRAQIFFVSPTEAHFHVPPATEIGTAEVVVTNSDGFQSRGTVPTLRAAPGVFTRSGDGRGEGMILDADTLTSGPFDPSSGTLRLIIFSTGVRNGLAVSVSAAGRALTLESIVTAPNMPGMDEIHVLVPADLRGAGQVDLVVRADARDSNPVAVEFIGDTRRDILINEFMADPPDGAAGDANRDGTRDTSQDEFVELVNTTTHDIDISGYQILTRGGSGSSDTLRHTFPNGTIITACTAIVVFGGGNFDPNNAAFGGAQVVKASSGSLTLINAAGVITLREPGGNIANFVAYGGSTGLDSDDNQSLTRAPDITGTFAKHGAASGGARLFSSGTQLNGSPFSSCGPAIARVEVAPASATIDAGQQQQFTARAFDSSNNEVAGVLFFWQSSNTGVATIDRNGLTTGLTAGSTQIRATGRGMQSAPATLIVNPAPPDLSISKTDSPDPVFIGSNVTYSIIVTNSGATTAQSVVVTDNLPAGVSFVSCVSTGAGVCGGTANNRTVTFASLASGASRTITLVATANGPAGTISNTATVSSTTPDPNTSNNSATANTVVQAPPPGLTINDITANEGNSGTTTFTFTVSLSSPAPANVTFDISTQNSTATVADNDYVARVLTAQTIPAGQQTYAFDVVVNGDLNVESAETFLVNVTNVSGAIVTDGHGLGTIENDDAASLVISQLYAGGGNAGAQFTNDFVEIFNRGNTTVNFATAHYSIQYAGATANFGSNKVDLTSGSVLPGQYFLVQLSGGASGSPLPAPDHSGSIVMAATAGKVALVVGTAPLSGSGCPLVATVADFIGYGATASCFEGNGPAPGPGNTTADFRKAGGCTDTNDNAADFFVHAPAPRNSSSPLNNCSAPPPNLSITDVTSTEGNSGSKIFTFTVSLSAPAQATDVMFDIATQDNTATTADNDYVGRSLTSQLLMAGQQTYSFEVVVNGDTAVEPDETFFVNVTNASGATVTDGQGVGTIENEDVPSLSINDVTLAEGDSGTRVFNFTASLSAALASAINFDIATQDNTATIADNDYVAHALTAQSIPAGQTTYNFAVVVNSDSNIEPNENFFVHLINVSGVPVTDGQGVGNIQNDDTAALSVSDVAMNEGNSAGTTFTFKVSSSLPAPSGGATFNIATQDGTATASSGDYVARSLTNQTIPAGQTSYNFDVTVNGDLLVEPDESFTVNITNVANATLMDGQGVGTIKNDDAANLVISQLYAGGGNVGAPFTNDFVEIFNRGETTVNFATTRYSIQYAGATANFGSNKVDLTSGAILPGQYFLVQLSGGMNGSSLPTPDASGSIAMAATAGKVALVVGTTALPVSTCPGDDEEPPFNPDNLAIADFIGYGATASCFEGEHGPAPAPSATTADYRRNGGCTDTNDNEADFFVHAPGARNTSSPFNNCTPGPTPTLTIDDVIAAEGNEGSRIFTFTVSLSTVTPSTDVTFDIATQDMTATAANNDYVARKLTKQFIPAGQQTYRFDVVVNGDLAAEPDEAFAVDVSNVTGAVIIGDRAANDSRGIGTIENDDSPTLSINDVSLAEGDSGTKVFNFTVSLSAPAPKSVFFDIGTADGSATTANNDYVGQFLGGRQIPAGQQTFTFSVLVNGDVTNEPGETFLVNVVNVVGATVLDFQGVGTILNDDSPVLSVNDVTVNEGDSDNTTASFTVTSSRPAPPGGITFNISTQDDTATAASGDYVSKSLTNQTIPAGMTTYTFDVTVNGDTLVEANETFLVKITSVSGAEVGDDTGQGTIQNDDTPVLVISQLYGGGGNVGASFSHDFIEIFNRGTTTVSLSGYSVQYTSASGTTWQATNLTNVTLAPGQYYLVHEAGGANGASLPAADANGAINMNGSAGKVALVSNTTSLSGACPSSTSILDLVGYGATTCFEGSGPAPAPGNTTADFRKSDGCVDTNHNTADFLTAAPSPRNTSSPMSDCDAADLSISKTDSPDPVTTGSNVTYTIVVTNTGPADAQSVVVTDNLPGSVSFVSCSSTAGGVCTGSGNNRTITFAALASGNSATITLVATANGAAGSTITNTATVASVTPDFDAADNSATATTGVQAPPPVVDHVTVSPSSATTNRGNTQQFAATAFDSGNQPIPGATFTWSSSNHDVATIDANGLATGVGIGTVTITATTSNGLGGMISGTAMLTVQVPLVINEILADVPPDIAGTTNVIEGDANRDGVRDSADDEFVELLNNSNASVDLSGVVITDATNAATSRFTFPNGTILAAGRAVVVFGGGTPPTNDPAFGGALVLASASSLSLNDGGDTVTVKLHVGGSDVQIAQVIYGGVGNAVAPSDQSLTRSPDAAVGTSGGSFVAHNTATNAVGRVFSPGTRTDGTPFGSPAITRIEVLPAIAAIDVGAAQLFTGHAYSNAGGPEIEVTNVSFIWDSSDTGKATVAPTTGRTTTATALASGSSTIRARAGGQSGTAALTVNALPSLSINDVTDTEGDTGTKNFQFTVTLSASSTSTVTVHYATADVSAAAGSDYASTSGTLTFNPGITTQPIDVTVNGDTNVEPNETFVINLTVPTNATISDPQGQGTITNDDVAPPGPDLSVNKSLDTASPVVGQEIVFTITLNNLGTSTATGVQVTDLLPTGLVFVSSTVSQGSYDSNTGIWTVGTVNNASSATLTITARVQTQGSKTNTATITASGATDPNPTNDQSSVTFTPGLPQLVISQLYTAGGASAALYNRDFIEIFNRGNVPINLSGFSVQYAATATGTFTVIASLPAVVLQPRQYFLITAGTTNAAVGANLPVSADVTGSNTNMTGSVGKVAIVFGTTGLTSSNVNNPPLTVGNPAPGCPTNNTIVVDFVGYGTTAACYEGTNRAPDPTATNNSQSDFRNNGGCIDTNDNGADFTRANALPRNSSTTKLSCP
jgi:uncharacterized repeat protein (TIGR01451 family)